jgi:hypothetical protein
MKNRIYLALIALATASLLSSCFTTKTHSWMNPKFEGRSLGKTMVLGMSTSESLSRQYETLFVDLLTERGITTSSLHDVCPTPKNLDEATLVNALQKNKFKSILVTRLLSEKERQQVINTGYYPSYYDNYYGYYSHGIGIGYNTAYVQNFIEFEIETTLYDVQTKQLVWTGRKIVYDDRTDLTNMKKVIKGVLKDLSKKGLL